MRVKMLLLIAGAICALAIRAQEKPSQEVRVSARLYAPVSPVLRVESDLVEVTVVVRGKDGRTIAGLTREDFQMLDQGKPQEITHFEVETASGSAAAATAVGTPAAGSRATAARPLRFIALFFDDFSTNRGHLKWAQTAARRFVNEGLVASDRVALFCSSSGRMLDFTADRTKLISAIDKLAPHPLFSENGLTSCPRINPYQAYQIAERFDSVALQAAVDEAKACSEAPDDGTAAYSRRPPEGDRVALMVKEQAEATWSQVRVASQATLNAIGGIIDSLSKMRGRRLLLLVSSGFITGSLERERDRLINQSLHAGIVINSMDAKGLYVEAPGRPIDERLDEPAVPESTFQFEAISRLSWLAAATDGMADLAQSTGGLFFHNNNDLAFGFRELGAMPGVSYTLAFRPAKIVLDGSYHKLKVRLTSGSYAVEARPGYFADAAEIAGLQDRRPRLDREVMAASTSEEFPIAVTYQRGGPGMDTGAVGIRVHIDISHLQFPTRNGRRVQQLEFVVALLDPKGDVVAAKEGTMDFALTDATYSRLSESGVNAGFTLEAPSGNYRLRVVVQEEVEGKLASSLQAVEVQ